jgi:DNA polymerase
MHEAGHFRVAATFHPAATIYNKDWAPLLVEDLRMVADWLAAHPAGEGDGAAGRDAQDARDAEAGRG